VARSFTIERMCGRYALRTSTPRLARMFGVEAAAAAPDRPPRYNIAPTQPVPVCRAVPDAGDHGEPGAPQREIANLRWGLVPRWAKSAREEYRMINARAETVASKPAYRSPFRHRRCLVPADGFYEWQRVGGRKQPCFICLEDQAPFAFAGLWERWEGGEDGAIESCSIITTRANDALAPIHERMPVILPETHWERWLDPGFADTGALEQMLVPCPAGAMQAWPVSTFVNNPRNDDERCLEPLADGAR